jgi:glycolate oxidase FAD binding subunit
MLSGSGESAREMRARNWLRAPEVAQFGACRPGESADAVDGVIPGLVIEPATSEQVAAALAWASRERLATVIRGRGTKLGWGRPPSALDVVLAMSGLNRVVAHRHGDLTATLQAGATLSDVNRELGRQHQWLPVDTPFQFATLGGIVATNDSGPLRHRYGTPRDLVIGITLALTDGRLVKAGGHVVKNVAGYDLGKLMSGSFGSLAAITDVTVKLSPIPQTSGTLAVRYLDRDTLFADAMRLSASQLEPVAFDVRMTAGGPGSIPPELRLFVRFAASPGATAAQIDAARALLHGETEVLAGAAEAALWAEQVRYPFLNAAVVVRLAWLPASLGRVLALVEQLGGLTRGPVTLAGRASTGAGFVRLDASDDAMHAAVTLLRERADVVSNVVVLKQHTALKQRIDAWGPMTSTAGVMRSLKQAFDPAGILNAGRGPI